MLYNHSDGWFYEKKVYASWFRHTYVVEIYTGEIKDRYYSYSKMWERISKIKKNERENRRSV